MAYSREFHDRAAIEIRKRRDDAEMTARQHKNELSFKYPEFQFIESELSKTGFETINAFSMPKEKAEKALSEIRENLGKGIFTPNFESEFKRLNF